MSKIIFRLDRGPFSGLVAQNTNGPYRGWFSYSWIAGENSGSCNAVGREHAISALKAACYDYFRKQPQIDRDQQLSLNLKFVPDQYSKI